MGQRAVLVVEDDPALREALKRTLDRAGFEVHCADNGERALSLLSTTAFSLVISDVQMDGMDGFELLKSIKLRQPLLPVVMITAYATVQKAVTAIREGAMDYLVKPFDVQTLVEKVNRILNEGGNDQSGMPLAEDPLSLHTLALARQVAPSEASVLLTGESGVGKEVLAHYLHSQSKRYDGPFVAINCAAIPENMLEATLFGYEKGAFTGAYQSHAGKFEQADGGTLLLDEITEMDLNLQAKLLRVLQEREVERLGGRKTIELNVRVLATSNRKLADYVKAGKFREDLFYRLNVFPIHIAPLRERPGDILPLAEAMLVKHAAQLQRPAPVLGKAARSGLMHYAWPGNVRELDNVIQRALILCQGTEIDAAHLHFESALDGMPAGSDATPIEHSDGELKQHENNLILEVLRSCMGSRKLAAEKLGISPRTLRYKLAKLRDQGIDIPEI